MEMRHLRYFVALAEHANFRRAADRLGIAQPPLSRQIRALERELGCRLVVRTSRGIELTAAGRAFLDQARMTLAQAQRAVDRARVAAPEAADRVVLVGEPTAQLAIVGRALRRLAATDPGMRVELREQHPADALRLLREGEVQAAAVALPAAEAGEDVVVEQVADVPLCLAVRVGHRLAGPRPVSWRRLADVPLVLYARDAAPVLFDAVLGTFQAHGIPVRPRHHAADLATALTLVAAGLGVTILPSGWQPPHALGVACRPLRPPLVTIALGVAHRRGGRSPSVARFIEAARAGGAGPRPRATTEAAPRAREPA